jgi:hypothetical protein
MRVHVMLTLLALLLCGTLGLLIAPASPVGAKPSPLGVLHRDAALPMSHAAKRLACVQPPSACSSNSDCTCSNCCAQFGDQQVCQPSC